ncbi:MAG: hypothetical protein H6739_30860 [Alphaproteobacteria bacterium]|nr:hypothetical protein [Alphaproteobacteria bacterium]
MRYSNLDIFVSVHIGHERSSIDPKMILHVFGDLERALYESDRRDVERFAEGFLRSDVVKDASLERLRRYRNRRLKIVDAKPGSLWITGSVLAVSYFVLEKTIGQSFVEGWQDTNAHRHLREFFASQIDIKYKKLAQLIESAFKDKNNRIGGRQAKVSVQLTDSAPSPPLPSSQEGVATYPRTRTILVEIDPEAGTQQDDASAEIPTYGDLLDRLR